MQSRSGLASFLRGVLAPEHEGHNEVPSTHRFQALDVEQIKVEQRLADKGLKRGRDNQPAPDETSLDAVEQEVATLIETQAKAASESYSSHLHTLAHRVTNLDLRGRAVEISTHAQNAITEFRRQVHEGQDVLFNERRHVIEIEGELRSFREIHKLSRPARYPLSRLFHFGFLGLVIVGETALNGVFFARGSDAGLIGGAGIAFAIAIANLVLGILLGRMVAPSLVHRDVIRKLVGFVFLAGLPAVIFIFNVGVAHYRDALGGDAPEMAAKIALTSFQTSFWGMKDIESWFLIIFGCACSLGAAYDAYLMDDPYPGYGPLSRRAQEATDSYTAEKNDLVAELTDAKSAAVEEMRRVRKDVSQRKGQFINLIGTRDHLRSTYGTHLQHLESCANDLLRTYRDANCQSRTTPRPAHFMEKWCLTKPAEPTIDPFAGLTPEMFDNETDNVLAALEKGIADMNSAFLEAMAEFKRIDQLTTKDLEDGTAGKAATVTA